jgi:hypothetical protein
MTPALPPPDHPDAPKYWMYETGGLLASALERYLKHPSRLTVRDLGLIRAYVCQWIDSPVWNQNPHGGLRWLEELADLRRTAHAIASPRTLATWLAAAVSAGVDPL